ncbi:uncharacterized protein ATC70_007838 [Mucor velutinosus]|uniref:F-box domain-containing protein n=1 Tax=Mucor velutinosus TaxID=708070 RepID=A0AAN7D7T0_9FUNG|nr:hypothetical protein ATC70_007838 [Mucor velutinosus]
MTAQDLPAEILTCIFSYVSPLEQIARCKLICKNWDKPAEAAMLGKHFYLDLASPTAEKYYAFLAKDRSRGPLVRGINYSPINGDKKRRNLLKKIVRLIFTPNIENLIGDSSNAEDDFVFEYMNEISGAQRAQYTKLQAMPLRDPVNDLYIKTLLNFKHTLTSLWFSKDPGHNYLINRLDQFTKLTNFTYAGNIVDLTHLEFILRKCPHLESLTLRIHQYSTGEMRSVLFKDEILDWAKANNNVTINTKLKKLELAGDGACSPEIWDYLVYKYPELEKVTLTPTDDLDEDGYMFQYQDETWLDYDRLSEAFKRIPAYAIEFDIESEFEEEDMIMALQRPDNRLELDVDEEEGVNRIIVRLR